MFKRIQKLFSSILCMLVVCNCISAKKYYLSVTGNDKNKGTSPVMAWQTTGRLNQQKLIPGDSVLLQCKGVFYGEIVVANSGTGAKPIVFSSYGLGNKPVLTGAKNISICKEKK